MKKLVNILLMSVLFFGVFNRRGLVVNAVSPLPSMPIEESEHLDDDGQVESLDLQQEEPLTEPLDEPTQGRLQAALERQKLGALSFFNFLKHAIRAAIINGVPTNTIVLIFLLPLVGTIVSALYYLVGLTGFGISFPTIIAISFLATGIPGGLVLFAVILLSTILVRKVLRNIKIHLRARRTIALWVVCLVTFGFLTISPSLKLFDLSKISIFPILFLILLSEEFIRFQTGQSRKKAISLTISTLLISIVGAALMSWSNLQEFVLLNPEISMLGILLVGFFIGRYTGFRLLEYKRFKAILKE